MRNVLSILSLGLIMVGCSLRPAMPEVHQTFEYKYDSYSINDKWWENFNDSKLDYLVELGLKNNSDLKLALINLQRAGINFNLATSDYFPSISLNGKATRNRSSGETYNKLDNITYNDLGVSTVLNYEVDLWGRVRNNVKAAKNSFTATKYDYETARLSIASTIVTTYLSLISLNEQRVILENTLNTYIQTLNYRKSQLDAGAINELVYYQAKASVDMARTQLIDINTQISQVATSLSILTAKNINDILTKDINTTSTLPSIPNVPDGISSDIMLHRADIASNLERLRASNFMVGVARTAWLPQLSLTGLFGFSSDEFNRFFVNNANTWSVGGSIVMPLLDFGRTKNTVELANLDQNTSLINYDKILKQAFGEIEDALSLRKYSVLKEQSMVELTKSQQMVYDLAKRQYDEGYSTHLEFLDSQRNLLDAKLNLAKAKLNVATSVVSVYKALGGGFNSDEKKE